MRTMEVDGHYVKLQIWDTAGQVRNPRIFRRQGLRQLASPSQVQPRPHRIAGSTKPPPRPSAAWGVRIDERESRGRDSL